MAVSRVSSPPARRPYGRTLAAAALCLGAFLLLGWAVTRYGEPLWLLRFEAALRGHALLVAWVLTWSCYAYVLAPLFAGLLVLAALRPRWRVPALLSVAVALLCWRGADLFQHLYARPRRLDWLVKHETSYSFPSSHAAISTGFYFLWANVLRLSTLPAWVRYAGFWGLTALTLAIWWSRLALAAHYATDLAGGALLAGAIAFAGLALCRAAGWKPFDR